MSMSPSASPQQEAQKDAQRPTRPSAVVVGAGLNGLGVIRSLGAAGIKTWLAVSDTTQPTAFSRHATRIPVNGMAGDALVDSLIGFAEGLDDPPALILTQEASVRAVSAARERLQPYFRFELPAQHAVLELTTKQGFESAAQAAGSPVPRTCALNGRNDLAAAMALNFPVIVKPDERDAAYDSNFKKAYKLFGESELAALYTDIEHRAPAVRLVAQEWIEGGDSDIYFCLQVRTSGKAALMSFCGRKLRSYPPMTGGTASCTIADPAYWDELQSLTNAFFAATEVVGLCSMEFKRDSNSGRFVMIEPTIGRTDFQEYVATLHGSNLPAVYVRNLFGLNGPDAQPARKRIWRDRMAEAQSLAMASVPDVVAAPKVDGLFAVDDPMPAVVDFSRRARNRIARLLPGSRKEAQG